MYRLILCIVAVTVSATASATEPPITAIDFAPSGDELVAVSQSGLHVFSWPELKLTRTVAVSMPNLHAVAFSADGLHIAVGGGYPSEAGDVSIFTWPAGKLVATLEDHEDSVRSVVWLNESKLVSTSIDRKIHLWDIMTDTPLATMTGHSRSVDAVCLLSDGKTLVSTGVDQSVRVWNLETSKLVHSLSQHTGNVNSLALRPGTGGLPMVASGAADRTIRFWQPTIGRMVRYVRLQAEPLNIAWANDGARILAACSDGHVRVIDPVDLAVTEDLPAIDGWAYAIAVHPSDGSFAVGGTNGQIRRIELRE